ncbi:MAG: MMPL family transporter [Propionicimonas sp.]
MSAFLYRLGRASYRLRGRVLAAWLVLLGLLGLLGLAVGGSYDDAFTIPGSSSQRALETLHVTFPQAADASATIVIGAPAGTRVDSPANQAAIEAYLQHLDDDLPFVKGTQTPFSEYVDGLVSADGSHALARVQVEGTVSTFTDEQRAELVAAAQQLTTTLPGSTVAVGGDVFSIHLPEISLVEGLGVVVALIVLVVVLGGFIPALLPIGTALAGVGLGVTVVMISTGVISISSTTLMLVVMLCLAVGMDYALFILSRHRDQLATGMDVEESAARAVATAGSAVVFAGATVIIALVGLSIAGLPFLGIMGVFTAVGVGLEVLLALTLLPALMGFLGERMRPKAPRPGRTPREPGRASRWWVGVVTRWPLVTVLVVAIGMGALAFPAKDLELALPNSGRATPGAPDRVAFDLVSQEFGIGYNGPLVIMGSIVELDDPVAALDGIRAEVEKLPGVELVAAATPNENADTGMIQVIPTTGPDDPATGELVDRLRAEHQRWVDEFGVDTAVTGLTAVQLDVSKKLGDALLPFGIFVVGLSLVLLAMAFRSIWVPIKAALGYLLSVGASFGLIALVFNQGIGRQLINLPEAGPVISFLPIILMGILFGLAMDYEVFLTSRMREDYVHGNERWIEDGFVHSAKVVIAAALIMFSVFAFFVPSGIGVIKPIAFGLAIGVAFDAFLVRMTLGPAVMKLMGKSAWWLPGWLQRGLPVLDVEGESLAHQTRLADWPAPGDTAALHAEGLRAADGEHVLFDGVSVRVEPGDVLVVDGDHLGRLALMYGLSGRARFTAGEAKVLGRVLPEEASLVRTKAPVLQATTADFAGELALASGGLVFVPAADELPDDLEAALIAALAAPPDPDRPTTWVLGVMTGTDPASLVPRGHRTLHLPSHLAVAGATR